MSRPNFWPIVLMGFAVLGLGACQQQPAESADLSQLALKGKRVFEQYQCGQCHYIGEEEVESDAPDLTNPFLANDSLFIQTHLKFVEDSSMPSVELTAEENRLVSYFVAELHAYRQERVSPDKADAVCPVCYASVSTERADAAGLHKMFLGESYYFECEMCLEAFRKAPEAFIELYNQYKVARGSSMSQR